MPVYIVTGKLGGGKTLAMVGRMREYIQSGRPVATNVDLILDRLCKRPPKSSVVRLPDQPTSADLLALGSVHDSGDESRNGALVLDECGTWLNSRQWQHKDRDAMVQWFLHTRKLGWDVYLVVQSLSMLDKQVRESLGEYVVTCRRLDRMRVPIFGLVGELLTLGWWNGRMPRVHLASVSYGVGQGAVFAEAWTYLGRDLYGAFRTTQVLMGAPGEQVGHGAHCLLHRDAIGRRAPAAPAVRKLKPKLPEVAALMSLPADERFRLARRNAASSGV